MKAKILYNDKLGRWKAGEISTVLKNTFEKYDYKIDLGTIKDTELFGKKIDFKRIYFFYKEEIEIIDIYNI